MIKQRLNNRNNEQPVAVKTARADGLGALNFLGFLNPLAENTTVNFDVAKTIAAIKDGHYYVDEHKEDINQNTFTTFVKENTLWVGIGGTLLVAALVGLVVWLVKRKK